MFCRTSFCGLGFVCLLPMNGVLLPCSVNGSQPPFHPSKIIHSPASMTREYIGGVEWMKCRGWVLPPKKQWFVSHDWGKTGRDRNSIISTLRCHTNLNNKCCYVTALGAQWTVDWNILEKSDTTKQVPVEFCLHLSNARHFWTLWGLHIPSVWHHCDIVYICVSPLRIVYIPHGSSLWSQSDQQLANALRKCEVLEFKKGVPWLTTWRLLVMFMLEIHGNSSTVHQPSLPFARLGVWSRSKMKKRKCWCQWLNPKPATCAIVLHSGYLCHNVQTFKFFNRTLELTEHQSRWWGSR